MPLHKFEASLVVDPERLADSHKLLTAVTNVRDVLSPDLGEYLYDTIEGVDDTAFVIPANIGRPQIGEEPINMGELEIRDAHIGVFTAHWQANTSSDASQAYSRLVRASGDWRKEWYFYADIPTIVLAQAVDDVNYRLEAMLYCFDPSQTEEHFPEAAARMQDGLPFVDPNTMSIEYVREQFALLSNPTS